MQYYNVSWNVFQPWRGIQGRYWDMSIQSHECNSLVPCTENVFAHKAFGLTSPVKQPSGAASPSRHGHWSKAKRRTEQLTHPPAWIAYTLLGGLLHIPGYFVRRFPFQKMTVLRQKLMQMLNHLNKTPALMQIEVTTKEHPSVARTGNIS